MIVERDGNPVAVLIPLGKDGLQSRRPHRIVGRLHRHSRRCGSAEDPEAVERASRSHRQCGVIRRRRRSPPSPLRESGRPPRRPATSPAPVPLPAVGCRPLVSGTNRGISVRRHRRCRGAPADALPIVDVVGRRPAFWCPCPPAVPLTSVWNWPHQNRCRERARQQTLWRRQHAKRREHRHSHRRQHGCDHRCRWKRARKHHVRRRQEQDRSVGSSASRSPFPRLCRIRKAARNSQREKQAPEHGCTPDRP